MTGDPWFAREAGRFAADGTDDEPPELAFYCSECAEREFRSEKRSGRGTGLAHPAPHGQIRFGQVPQNPCRPYSITPLCNR